MMKINSTRHIAFGGVIAALYVVLTYVANMLGLASGAIQIRISEALTIMPVLTAAAVPGVTIGCLLANILTARPLWDVVLGTLATLIGAVGTRLLKKKPSVAWIPPVLSNAAIVPIVLMFCIPEDPIRSVEIFGHSFTGNALWPMLAITVGTGEMISCGVLGLALYHGLKRTKIQF